jgi:hypothetical protein
VSREDSWETLFECLKARPRRRLLTGLAAHDPAVTVRVDDVFADEAGGSARVPVEYVHVHLPKLDAAGYIVWDDRTREVSRGPRFDEVEPFLELVQTHSDRLPDGWV